MSLGTADSLLAGVSSLPASVSPNEVADAALHFQPHELHYLVHGLCQLVQRLKLEVETEHDMVIDASKPPVFSPSEGVTESQKLTRILALGSSSRKYSSEAIVALRAGSRSSRIRASRVGIPCDSAPAATTANISASSVPGLAFRHQEIHRLRYFADFKQKSPTGHPPTSQAWRGGKQTLPHSFERQTEKLRLSRSASASLWNGACGSSKEANAASQADRKCGGNTPEMTGK